MNFPSVLTSLGIGSSEREFGGISGGGGIDVITSGWNVGEGGIDVVASGWNVGEGGRSEKKLAAWQCEKKGGTRMAFGGGAGQLPR